MTAINGILKWLLFTALTGLLLSCGGGGDGSGSGTDNLSSNADLSDLSLSAASLTPGFDAAVTAYTASVTNDVTSTTLTPTQDDANASTTVNGVAVPSGSASAAVTLNVGQNDIDIVVTAEDGVTQKTYVATVTRASRFSSRTAQPLVFIADRETDGVNELYAAFDDGGAEPIKLSEPLVSDGQVIDFAFSPDKSFVAYRADQETDEKTELYVVPVDPSNANYKIANAYKVSGTPANSNADIRSFAWSPDSTRLVFLADADVDEADELYMVDAGATNLRKINGGIGSVVEIGDYAWSPDSRFVAYKVYNRNLPNEVIGLNSHDSTVTSGTGFSVRLNPTLVSGGSIRSFAWSPDFSTASPADTPWLVYLADQDVLDQTELYRSTASVSNTSAEIHPSLQANEVVAEYAWSPSGEYIAFLIRNVNVIQPAGMTSGRLYSRDASLGSNAVQHSIVDQARDFAWSPDSSHIAFLNTTVLSDSELFVATPSTTELRLSAIPVRTANDEEEQVKRFVWSPDSASVAYLDDHGSDEDYELYISDLSGARTGHKVSGALVENGDVLAFAWSPDGSMLAYRADGQTAGVDALYSSHADGDWTGTLLSSANPPAMEGDIGVFSFSWADDSAALTYHAAETSEALLELYSTLADGGAQGSVLSGSLVTDGDISRHFAYENSARSQHTRQTRVTNLFKDGSFIEPGTVSELCGIAYEPGGDVLFITKCVHRGNSKILKYSFVTQLLSEVYDYPSQWDYGLRLLNDELWLVRTYDDGIQNFSGLQDSRLSMVSEFFKSPELSETIDITLSEGDLYVVTGNFTGGDNQHNGIQRINGPAFNTIDELVAGATANWPTGGDRSIVAVGSGVDAHLIVASGGSNSDIERWDLNGNFINSVSGFGSSYLQKDSLERIYSVSASSSGVVTRWAANLGAEESFSFNSILNSGSYVRYALREMDTDIEVIITRYRDRDPRFDLTSVPQ